MKLYPFKIMISSLIALLSICTLLYSKAPVLFDILYKHIEGINNE